MTIQGSKRPAAVIALGVVVMLAVLAPSAVLLKQPALLLLLVIIAPIQLLLLLLQMRPTSLTFDGADVVYRAGGPETRAPRTDIATCALVGRAWIFSNSAGAPLIALPAFRFAAADVAAFCKQAGLHPSSPPVRAALPCPQRRTCA